jgi:hypothetical protein
MFSQMKILLDFIKLNETTKWGFVLSPELQMIQLSDISVL